VTESERSADILVIGTGAAGLSAAIALATTVLSVIAVGAVEQFRSGRTVALFEASLRFYDALGLWPQLEDCAQKITTIRMVDATGVRMPIPPIEFSASEIGLPAFGENISTFGVSEADICIGDVYRLGSALLQVSQGRQPCWRLNARFERPDMAFRVQKSGRTGWYYRVLEEGMASAGNRLTLEDRPRPQWPLIRIIDLLYTRTLDMKALADLAALPELAQSWRTLATRRIETHSVENWDRRLHGAS